MIAKRHRDVILTLLAVVVLIIYVQPFLRDILTVQTPEIIPVSISGSSGLQLPWFCPTKIDHNDFSPHGIQCRVKTARQRALALRRAQSTTPDEAIAEYTRRYGRSPPRGFHDWVVFALQHDSKVIDDFDQIDRDLQPFRAAEAQAVFRKMGQQEDWMHMRRITFENAEMTQTKGQGYIYEGPLADLVAPFVHAIPNGSVFYANTIDEPRILCRAGPMSMDLAMTDSAGENIEDLVVESCRQLPRELTGRLGREKDVCQYEEPSKIHGFLASPDTFTYMHSLAPVLSIGRISAFRDILIPCPCYLNHPILEADPTSFEEKKPALYWRGSSTGLRNLKTTWRSGHRQRFVAFVQSLQRAAVDMLNTQFLGTKISKKDKRRADFFKELFDVGFGGYLQCDESVCEEMRSLLGHPFHEQEDISLDYQYVYDIDGNSMSTRFYRLLSRNSVVLKQTLFQEWHDDRLVPWVHYVPVTMEMQELPALMTFLVTDPKGRELSREIAEEGARWSRQVLRKEDMSIYVYRLLLELADIFNPEEEMV